MASEFSEYIFGEIAELGEIEMSRFFGGTGFKIGDIQFAMCMHDTLYLVVNDSTPEKYINAGSQPFSYATKKGRRLVHRYYQVPDEILEHHSSLIAWVQEAMASSMKMKR